MYAKMNINAERDTETLIEVFSEEWDAKAQETIKGVYRLACWGGADLMTGEPYIVFTPPGKLPHYSLKSERLYKVFLLAAHVHFSLTGEMEYRPKKITEAYNVLWPEYGMEQELPKFKRTG